MNLNLKASNQQEQCIKKCKRTHKTCSLGEEGRKDGKRLTSTFEYMTLLIEQISLKMLVFLSYYTGLPSLDGDEMLSQMIQHSNFIPLKTLLCQCISEKYLLQTHNSLTSNRLSFGVAMEQRHSTRHINFYIESH